MNIRVALTTGDELVNPVDEGERLTARIVKALNHARMDALRMGHDAPLVADIHSNSGQAEVVPGLVLGWVDLTIRLSRPGEAALLLLALAQLDDTVLVTAEMS